jgi:hypothetical protein
MNDKYFETVFLECEAVDEFPESFAIVTACNPMDQILSQAENGKRNQQLLDILNSRGQYVGTIIGSSQDLTHQEPSLIVRASRAESLELGISFEQSAIFWVSKDLLEIMECSSGNRHPIGSFRKRIRTGES